MINQLNRQFFLVRWDDVSVLNDDDYVGDVYFSDLFDVESENAGLLHELV